MAELGAPHMIQVDREQLVLLGRIRRLAQAHRMSTDEQHERTGRELDEAIAEHYQRFERNPQERWRGRVA